MIRLTRPSIDEEDLHAVRDVLSSGYLVQGERVGAFERAVADYVGVPHAVAVSSCTAALHLSLISLDIRPGDLVLVAAYSFVATANVIELCGARPLFVDIEPDGFNLDPNRLEDILIDLMASRETADRVKAILPVHTFGRMADMRAITRIAARYELPVIEDGACSLGARLDGRQCGTWGKAGCFSFHPRKAVTTGEGGMIVTSDSNLARRIKALRNHGQDPDLPWPEFIMPGFNYRMTEFQAALGLTQMGKLDRIISARRRLASRYDELLKDSPVRVPARAPGNDPVYQSYVVLLPEEAASHRKEIIARLRDQGIETTIGTWNMPLTSYYRTRYGYTEKNFPVASRIFRQALTLPLYENLGESEQDMIVDRLISLLNTPA